MTELKPQHQLARIDFGNPKMQPMIRMMQGNIRRETRKWQPEADMRLCWTELSAPDMAPFSCLIL